MPLHKIYSLAVDNFIFSNRFECIVKLIIRKWNIYVMIIAFLNCSLDGKEISLIRSKPSIVVVVVGLSPVLLYNGTFFFFTTSMHSTLC